MVEESSSETEPFRKRGIYRKNKRETHETCMKGESMKTLTKKKRNKTSARHKKKSTQRHEIAQEEDAGVRQRGKAKKGNTGGKEGEGRSEIREGSGAISSLQRTKLLQRISAKH